jgi:hypothetical protein
VTQRRRDGSVEFAFDHADPYLRDLAQPFLQKRGPLRIRFDLPTPDGQIHLARTHPLVEGLAAHVLATALDPVGEPVAARTGAIRTADVDRRTILLLVRYRFDVTTARGGDATTLLAEDTEILAYTGSPDDPTWIAHDEIGRLLNANPAGNVPVEHASAAVSQVISSAEILTAHLNATARRRADELAEAHDRVREEARARGRTQVAAHTPVDVLGVYILLPVPKAS